MLYFFKCAPDKTRYAGHCVQKYGFLFGFASGARNAVFDVGAATAFVRRSPFLKKSC